MSFDLDRGEVEQAVREGNVDFLWSAYETATADRDGYNQERGEYRDKYAMAKAEAAALRERIASLDNENRALHKVRHNFLALQYALEEYGNTLAGRAQKLLDHARVHSDGRMDWPLEAAPLCCNGAEELRERLEKAEWERNLQKHNATEIEKAFVYERERRQAADLSI